MQGSPEHKQKDDIFALLEKHRQEVEACNKQQAEIEERLERFRHRQHALQADLEAIRAVRQSLHQYQQAFERKQQGWLWRYGKGL